MKENLKNLPKAEDAQEASPAESVAVGETSLPAAARRATDAELAHALQRFGWRVTERKKPGKPERDEAEDFTAVFRKLEEETLTSEAEAGEASPDSVSAILSQGEDVSTPAKAEAAESPAEPLSEPVREETHIFTQEDISALAEQPPPPPRPRERKVSNAPTVVRPERKSKASPAPKREAPAVEYRERDYMPIRRRRSYRTGLRGGLMYFGFVICVSVILASVGWLAADDVLSLNKDIVEAEIFVGEDRDMEQVSAELYNKGLIRYRPLFRVFAKLVNAETKVDPGVYTISSRLDYNAMIHAMQKDDSAVEERATVTVMIPEGKTLKQTFQILAEHGVCPYETLLECAASHEFDFDFLEGLPYGEDNRLEGYLFPDTYEFFAPSQPEEAIGKFLSNFSAKMNTEMKQKVEESGYSLREILTVASLIEMEAGSDTERATIASVIFNRLSSSAYPYLQVDATIQYALEERKPTLTSEDLEIDSPYNTYKYPGLPPGPIANPGMASIRAALSPETTGYYFYALNKHGTHNFFTTMSQFEYFVYSSDFGG